MQLAQVLRHPAPALHVDDQALHLRARGRSRLVGFDAGVERGARPGGEDARGLDLVLLLERFHRVLHLQVVGVLRAAGHLQAEPPAQQCDLRMLAADLEARPVGQPHARGVRLHRLRGDVAAAGLQQGLAQLQELLVLGIEVAQGVAGRLGGGHGLQHDLGIAQAELHVDILADLRRVEAAAARVAGILEGGEAQLDLGAGQSVRRCSARRKLRQLEGGRREPPVVGFADLRHGVLGLGREAVARHPEQGLVALGIECGERSAILAIDVALGRLGQLAAHLGEHRIDRRRGWLLGGGRRRRRRGLGSRRCDGEAGGWAGGRRAREGAGGWAAAVAGGAAGFSVAAGGAGAAAACCGAALGVWAAASADVVCAAAGAPATSASTSGAAMTAEIAQPVRLNIRESLQIGAQTYRPPWRLTSLLRCPCAGSRRGLATRQQSRSTGDAEDAVLSLGPDIVATLAHPRRRAPGAERGYLAGIASASDRDPPNLKLSRAVTVWMSTPPSTWVPAGPPAAGIWLRVPVLSCT